MPGCSLYFRLCDLCKSIPHVGPSTHPTTAAPVVPTKNACWEQECPWMRTGSLEKEAFSSPAWELWTCVLSPSERRGVLGEVRSALLTRQTSFLSDGELLSSPHGDPLAAPFSPHCLHPLHLPHPPCFCHTQEQGAPRTSTWNLDEEMT